MVQHTEAQVLDQLVCSGFTVSGHQAPTEKSLIFLNKIPLEDSKQSSEKFDEMINSEFGWQGGNRLSDILTQTEERPLYSHPPKRLSAMFWFCLGLFFNFLSPSGTIPVLKSIRLRSARLNPFLSSFSLIVAKVDRM